MMNHPPDDCEDFLKGVKETDALDEGGFFDASIFTSDMGPIPQLPDWHGSSINWDLTKDGSVSNHLLGEIGKGDKPKFKFGAIRIKRAKLDELVHRYGEHILDYELRPENGVDSHGHILISSQKNDAYRRRVCFAIINLDPQIHKQENNNV